MKHRKVKSVVCIYLQTIEVKTADSTTTTTLTSTIYESNRSVTRSPSEAAIGVATLSGLMPNLREIMMTKIMIPPTNTTTTYTYVYLLAVCPATAAEMFRIRW